MTPAARAWLTNARKARVFHIFDRACNLINEHREFFSIVSSQIGNGPFNLVIEEELPFSEYLNLQSSISYSDNQLKLGRLLIQTVDAKPWNPRPDWGKLHSKRDNIANHLIQLPITCKGPRHREHISA